MIVAFFLLSSFASLVAGHPRVFKAAVFDIISTDVANGCPVSIAESIIIMDECLDSFPTLSQHYEIHISHSKGNVSYSRCCFDADGCQVIELALNRVPHDIRDSVLEIITQAKSSWAQKRALLLKKGLLRSTVDELEVLSDTGRTPLVFWTNRRLFNGCRRGSRNSRCSTREGLPAAFDFIVAYPG
jgi:hypothetical protein